MRILCALLLVLPCLASAQGVDPRWPLVDRDTMLLIPESRVREWAANRLGQDYLTRTCDLITATLSSQNAGLRKIADTERQSKEAMRAAWEGCETERADLLVDRDRWKGKAQRRNRNSLLYTLAGVLVGIILTR